jgi:hypothetical protein
MSGIHNLRETGWDGMGWIDLAQDRDQWRALVNTAINTNLDTVHYYYVKLGT